MWSGWRYGNSRKREEFSNYVRYRTSFFGILGWNLRIIPKVAFTRWKGQYNTYEDCRNDSWGENISLATNVFFRDYEYSSEFKDVDEFTYDITEEARKEAMNAEHESEVPSIYRRNIAAKIAYEHFVGEGKWR